MLILLCGSGKSPSSLRRRKTTKGRVWLLPAGVSAPTRRRPRVTAPRFLSSIHPCVTLISNQSPNFNPRRIQIDLSRIQGFQGAGMFPVVMTTRVNNNRIYLNLFFFPLVVSRTSRTAWRRFITVKVHVAVSIDAKGVVLWCCWKSVSDFSAPTLRGGVGGQTRLHIFYNLKYPLLTRMVIKKRTISSFSFVKPLFTWSHGSIMTFSVHLKGIKQKYQDSGHEV